MFADRWLFHESAQNSPGVCLTNFPIFCKRRFFARRFLFNLLMLFGLVVKGMTDPKEVAELMGLLISRLRPDDLKTFKDHDLESMVRKGFWCEHALQQATSDMLRGPPGPPLSLLRVVIILKAFNPAALSYIGAGLLNLQHLHFLRFHDAPFFRSASDLQSDVESSLMCKCRKSSGIR